MNRNTVNILIGLVIGVFFLWLSVRNVDFQELRLYVNQMSYGWILPYFVLATFSFWLRAERWRLIVETDTPQVKRANLFSGVMFGYLTNYAVPRLGEITRSVYVARKEGMSKSNVFGTVVLERVIDLVAIFLMVTVVVFFVASDRETFSALFGPQATGIIDDFRSWQGLMILAAIFSLSAVFFWRFVKFVLGKRPLEADDDSKEEVNPFFRIIYTFTDGFTAIRKLKKWPLFVFYTVVMWLTYALMSYVPFYAFSMTTEFGLGFTEAFVVMTISTIGVVLPSPGALGTYHWFVKQTLLVIYLVPAVTGLAYAFITHAAMLMVVLILAPICWLWQEFAFSNNEL